jgi:tetratricopeptide (TPR) repeat protein
MMPAPWEGHHVTTRALAAALVGATVALATVQAAGSPLSRTRTQEGYALAYDLQFEACYDALSEAAAADPHDPAPRRAIAAVTWIEILFAQGVATFESFTGQISKGDVTRPTPPPILAARFHVAIQEARGLAEQQLAHADESDAHYQVGATAALFALYQATVEGRTLGAFSQGRRAVIEMERARAREPRKREPALVLGMSEYTVSTMSWPVRTLARLRGLSGNREAGLALLREAASPEADTQTDALLLLMIIANREGRHGDALQHLEVVQRLHPGNRLFPLNHGVTALAAGQPQQAEEQLSRGIMGRQWEAPPRVLGETALWFVHRGTARARLQRASDALTDLQRGLTSEPRDWVRGRLHAQLGDLALAAGDRAHARREFEAAFEFSERGGDQFTARDVKRKLGTLRP